MQVPAFLQEKPNTYQAISTLPTSFDLYSRHGWALVPIPPGTKGPRNEGWNRKENCITNPTLIPQGYGVGLAHAYSGTMALDIDDEFMATMMLSEQGVMLHELLADPEAVTINSGVAGRGKLIYAMPFGLTLPSKKINYKTADGTSKTAYELRCATKENLTVQDVIPPSIHPTTGRPYQWGGRGNWQNLPLLPVSVLAHWQKLLEQDDQQRLINNSPVIKSTNDLAVSWNDIDNALEHIPASCGRDEWITVGMALHYAGHQTGQLDDAFDKWDQWSQKSPEKYKASDMPVQWRSFDTTKAMVIKLGSLFHIAKNNGYVLHGHRKLGTEEIRQLFAQVPASKPSAMMGEWTAPMPKADLSIFPECLQKRVFEVSESVGCDPIIPLYAGLATLSAVADARSRLQLREGYEVPPILWLMTVGAPGDKKSPGSSAIITPTLERIQASMQIKYKHDMQQYEAREMMYQAAKKNWLDGFKNPEMLLGGSHAEQEILIPQNLTVDPPKPPVEPRLYLTDATSQKVVRMAAERPEGMLLFRDEMMHWVNQLNSPASGQDRSAWTASYDARPYMMDRVGDGKGIGSALCENFAISIYGNVQPEVLREANKGMAVDGLLQRFIPGLIDFGRTNKGKEIPIDKQNKEEWELLCQRIYETKPQIYKLSPEAKIVFDRWQDHFYILKHDEHRLESTAAFRESINKLEGTLSRMCLILHLAESPDTQEVSARTLERAISFIDNYVLPALDHLFAEVVGSPLKVFERAIRESLIYRMGNLDNPDRHQITITELRRNLREKFRDKTLAQANQIITDSMDSFERYGWTKKITDNHLTTVWALNERIYLDHVEEHKAYMMARQRRFDRRKEVKEAITGYQYPRQVQRGYDTNQDATMEAHKEALDGGQDWERVLVPDWLQ